MIEGFMEAQEEIAEAAARDLPWFAPPERKQFLGEAVLFAFASLLLSAFLAGFMQAVGKKVAEYLWEAISDLFSGKHDSEARNELEIRAADAPRIATDMTEEHLTALLAKVEEELKSALQEKLPAERASKLARGVSKSARKHVLSIPQNK